MWSGLSVLRPMERFSLTFQQVCVFGVLSTAKHLLAAPWQFPVWAGGHRLLTSALSPAYVLCQYQ